MRLNTTKQKLAGGATVTGVIINENAPASLELLARIGCFDFVMIDCEHGPMSLFDVENLVRACEGAGLTPLARVPDHTRSTILRFLDRGVQGVIVPHVNTAEQAIAVARAARYYPEGLEAPRGRDMDPTTHGRACRSCLQEPDGTARNCAHWRRGSGYLGMASSVAAVIVAVRAMVMRVRTGPIRRWLSTTGLARMAAAGLGVTYLDPVVAQDQSHFAAQRHRLSQVREER